MYWFEINILIRRVHWPICFEYPNTKVEVLKYIQLPVSSSSKEILGSNQVTKIVLEKCEGLMRT